MYCPQCSQQQSSDEMRYCSRCGFPLSAVSALLNNKGMIPEQAAAGQVRPAHRSRMILESVLLTAFCWTVALLATAWFDAGGPLETVAKIAALVFSGVGLIGLLRFLYAFLLVRDSSDSDAASVKDPGQVASREPSPRPLPPQQRIPLTDWPRRTNTREMAPQPSVTENTTRLLDDDAAEPAGN